MIESAVLFFDVFNNAIAYDDVTFTEAMAGDTVSYEVQLYNQSKYLLSQINVWIDRSVQYIKISDDDATWVQPQGDAGSAPSDALLIPKAAPGNTTSFYMQRIIPVGTSGRRRVTNIIHWSFFGGPEK